jgi:hypothetical protein
MSNTTLIHADIFFFIASIGFILTTLLLAVIFGYLISTLRSVRRITGNIEAGMHSLSEDAKDLLDDLRNNLMYRLLFGQTSSHHKKSKPLK